MRLLLSKPLSLRLTVTALILVGSSAGLSACRLGANNTEKLSALKSGEVYDEDGLLTVSISSPVADTLINLASNSSTYAVTGDCTPNGSEITLSIDDSLVSATPAVCSDGKWSTTFDATALADGTHSLQANAVRNGKSKVSETIAFTKSVALPQLAILSPSNGGFVNSSTNSATFAVSGTCSESGQSVSVKVDGTAASSQVGGSCNGATWAATISTLGLSAGAHTMAVSMTSASGNASTSDPVLFTLDTTAPTVAITAPSSGTYIYSATSVANYNISGSCNDLNAMVQVRINGSGSGWVGCTGGTNWGQLISTAALSEATHTLTAVIQDPAGNSSTSAAITITKDVTAPSIAISSPTANSYVNLGTNSTTFAINGTCSGTLDSGRNITVQLNGSNATQSTISCGAGNTWSGTFSTASLSEASHTLSATLSDVAGNSTSSAAITLIKDATRPTVTLTYPVAGYTIGPNNSSTSHSVKGTCSENSGAVTILVNGSAATGVASNTCSSGTFSATINTTGLANATHTITATQTDAAGNAGPASPPSVSVAKDTSLPLSSTFTRTSVAHDPYTGAQSASGVARYPRVGSARGLLMEEGTTNLAQYSDDFGQSSVWTSYYAGVFTDAAVAPDGTTTADNIVQSPQNVGYGSYYQAYAISGATAGRKFTSSIWLKGTAGAQAKLYASAKGGASAQENSMKTVTLTGDWEFHSVSITLAANDRTHAQIQVQNSSTGNTALYVWRAQLEEKGYATSGLQTTNAAVVRQPETITFPTQGQINLNQGTILVRAYVGGELLNTSVGRYYYMFAHANYTSSYVDVIYLRRLTSNHWQATLRDHNGNDTSISHAGSLSEGWHTFGLTFSPTAMTFYIDGTKIGTTANPYLPTVAPSTFSVGNFYGSTYEHWNQPIDWVAIYQSAKTDPEMQTYTSTGPVDPDTRYDFEGVTFSRTSVAHDPLTGVQSASGVARFGDVNGGRGLLIEDTTTNLLTQSDDFSHADWFKTNVTVTANATTAPDGTATADKIEATSTSNPNVYYSNFTAAADRYTGSVCLKAGNITEANISLFQNSIGSVAQTARVISGPGTLAAAGNAYNVSGLSTSQWSCFEMTTNAAVTAGQLNLYVKPYGATAAAVGNYLFAWRAQLERKRFATSGIATTTAGIMRSAETLTIPTEGVFNRGNWGAVFVLTPTTRQTDTGRYGTIWTLYIDANNSYQLVGSEATNGKPYLQIRAGGSQYTTYNTSDAALEAGTTYRIGIKGNGSTFTVYLNGSKVAAGDRAYSETTGTLPSVMYLGSANNGIQQLNAYYDKVAFYTTAPTDAEMAAYTTTGPVNANWVIDFNNSLGQ